MAKKSAGFFTLLLGVAAGAAAVLLSSKDNRQKATREIQKAKKMATDLEKHPEKVAKKVVSRSKKVAAVAVGTVTVTPKKTPSKKTTKTTRSKQK